MNILHINYIENYDSMVDIWSFGLIVLELITSNVPWKECKNAFMIYTNLRDGIKPLSLESINDLYVKQFIDICLNINSKQRPTPNELLNHRINDYVVH